MSAGAETLSADEHGVKVLLTADGRVIKLFRRKRWLSSTILWPYAQRFARASRGLAARGIAAAVVDMAARVPAIHRDLVVYRHLPGCSLREALASGGNRERLLTGLAGFLATLHERGVYFRAAHFGNFLARDISGSPLQWALIDLSEARLRKAPLSPLLRARNFRPFTRYPEDLTAVQVIGVDRFVQAYLAAAKLQSNERGRFKSALHQVHPAFHDVI